MRTTTLARMRLWASQETLGWIDWVRDRTGLNTSRMVEQALQLMVFTIAEREAGRKVVSMNADGTDMQEITAGRPAVKETP